MILTALTKTHYKLANHTLQKNLTSLYVWCVREHHRITKVFFLCKLNEQKQNFCWNKSWLILPKCHNITQTPDFKCGCNLSWNHHSNTTNSNTVFPKRLYCRYVNLGKSSKLWQPNNWNRCQKSCWQCVSLCTLLRTLSFLSFGHFLVRCLSKVSCTSCVLCAWPATVSEDIPQHRKRIFTHRTAQQWRHQVSNQVSTWNCFQHFVVLWEKFLCCPSLLSSFSVCATVNAIMCWSKWGYKNTSFSCTRNNWSTD